MTITTFSDKGQRATNQDFILVSPIHSDYNLYLIADGMGGYGNGEQAAKIVAENILTYLSTVKEITEKEVQKAVNKANLAIRQYKQDKAEKMGATVGGVVLHANKGFCFWVGDVAIFHYQHKHLHFESQPHTLMNELRRNGSISDKAQLLKYKHVVVRSVQGDITLSQVDCVELDTLTNNDLLIVCSDGVHDVLDGYQIHQILNTSENVEAALMKIEQQLRVEAKDNFSLIALDLI